MAHGGRDVAIAIAVSDAKPLPFLRGALNGARDFHDWASKLGYDSRLVTDEDQPVTLTRLRSELEATLRTQPIHRILIYFAGHGLIREAEEGLWLLSDWNDELKAVAVEVLRRRLYMHDIQQVGIISDSCRSLPPNITAADLSPDPVLGRGPLRELKQPAVDKFIAAQDGSATFVIPGTRPEEDRCLFSGVLMEGLWGTRPEAFSKILTDKVTSRSLTAFLETEVPRRAEVYKRRLIPTVIPTFPEGDDVYFGAFGATGPPPPPWLPEWPTAESVATDLGRFRIKRPLITGDMQLYLMMGLRSQPRPDSFETRSGFAVDGGKILGLWTAKGVMSGPSRQSNWWHVGTMSAPYQLLASAEPVLIEFEDGEFAAVTALPNFVTTVLRGYRGVSAVIYRPRHEARDTASMAEEAIARMELGGLRADAVIDLAVKLREMKHVDPVLGVISAYLYDAAGDVDNIRRMAFFYVQNGQPIPFDIALLGALRCKWQDGKWWAQVPAVSERKPRSEAERKASWSHSKTGKAEGAVAGVWPWMRQGWTFLDEPTDGDATPVLPGLTALRRHLMPGRFTTMNAEGGKRLAKLFGLANRQLSRKHQAPPAKNWKPAPAKGAPVKTAAKKAAIKTPGKHATQKALAKKKASKKASRGRLRRS